MIPRDWITEWRFDAPWIENAQVEHDLVISRALIELFSNQHWEQGARSPRGPARVLLRVVERNSKAVIKAIEQ